MTSTRWALYKTVARRRIETTRGQRHAEQLLGLFDAEDAMERACQDRSCGARTCSTSKCSSLAANSGSADDSIVSPKFSLILGPWQETEPFVNVGKGFHSNDARGTTIRVDPTGWRDAGRLRRSAGRRAGRRYRRSTAVLPNVQLTASLWTLKLDSELLFVGDAGITEASLESATRHRSRRDLELRCRG